MPEFIIAQTEDDYREARALLREYEAALGIDLCFQDFPEELESLERMYGPPGGRFLLLRAEGRTAGCVALMDSGGKTCEMKRLYVRPEFRGRGLGRRCAERIVQEARGMGYASVRLHTLPSMRAAIALYRSMGFREIDPLRRKPRGGRGFHGTGVGVGIVPQVAHTGLLKNPSSGVSLGF